MFVVRAPSRGLVVVELVVSRRCRRSSRGVGAFVVYVCCFGVPGGRRRRRGRWSSWWSWSLALVGRCVVVCVACRCLVVRRMVSGSVVGLCVVVSWSGGVVVRFVWRRRGWSGVSSGHRCGRPSSWVCGRCRRRYVVCRGWRSLASRRPCVASFDVVVGVARGG